jgi:hypothetical protein
VFVHTCHIYDTMNAQAIYFTKSGIIRGAPFSYDLDTVTDIKRRNPALQDIEFQLLRGNFGETNNGVDKRPFPIIQAALIGPLDMMPWLPDNRNYTLLEWYATVHMYACTYIWLCDYASTPLFMPIAMLVYNISIYLIL